MKQYLKNLWLAILNKKTPSGLEPNTWYKFYKDDDLEGFCLTDKYGCIVPFKTHASAYVWNIETRSIKPTTTPVTIIKSGWLE